MLTVTTKAPLTQLQPQKLWILAIWDDDCDGSGGGMEECKIGKLEKQENEL